MSDEMSYPDYWVASPHHDESTGELLAPLEYVYPFAGASGWLESATPPQAVPRIFVNNRMLDSAYGHLNRPVLASSLALFQRSLTKY